jgi:hypothetical protein
LVVKINGVGEEMKKKDVEHHVSNSGTALWGTGKEGKEKRMREHQ